jgi:hypothetical protein
MPMTDDEPQTFAWLSCWIGHTRQEVSMAGAVPDDVEDDDEDEDELEDDELEDDELEDEDDEDEDDEAS